MRQAQRLAAHRTWVELVVFVVLAFAFSWTLYLTAPSNGGRVAAAMRVLATFGPTLAAIAVLAATPGFDGLRRLRSMLSRWRISWRWYAGALVGPPLVLGAGAAVYVIAGGRLGPTENDAGMWWAIPVIFGVVLVAGGPLGEELGWRELRYTGPSASSARSRPRC